MMNLISLSLLFMALAFAASAEDSIFGKVPRVEGCSKRAMVWLSLDKDNYKERLLLMHTEVTEGGTFKFYVKPGRYQIRGSDEAGCEFLAKVEVKSGDRGLSVVRIKK